MALIAERAADHLAARIGQRAAVEARLRLGLEHPVRARIADREEIADRNVEPDPVVVAAGFQEQHAVLGIGRQPVGDDAAGGAGADDDIVEITFELASAFAFPLTVPSCPGLEPGIHVLSVRIVRRAWPGDKPGHDGVQATARLLGPCWADACLHARQAEHFQPEDREPPMPIVNRVADLQPDIQAWRRDIHENPELLYDVHRTAAFVADRLREFGCDEVATGLGRTGVVGVIKGKQARRQGRHQGDRAARRHGRAADRGSDQSALRLQDAGQDARLRP